MQLSQFSNLIKFYFQSKSTKDITNEYLSNIAFNIQSKKNKGRSAAIERLRKTLKRNKDIITVEDLGAGSQFSKDKKRSIASIAKSALSPRWQCQILSNIVDEFKHKSILELGTSLGISTLYLGLDKPETKTYTLEGSKSIAKIAQDNFKDINFSNYELILGNFDNTLPKLVERLKKVDLAFIDGNHTKNATIKYYEWIKTKCTYQSVIVFDDIYWSREMQDAWQYIITKNEISASLDFYAFGIVFFDKKLEGNYKLIGSIL